MTKILFTVILFSFSLSSIAGSELSFKIKTFQSSYFYGEPIYILYYLENKSSVPKQYAYFDRRYQGLYVFLVDKSNNDTIFGGRTGSADGFESPDTISPHQIVSNLDLIYPYDDLRIKKPGKYEIFARWGNPYGDHDTLSSSPLEIEITPVSNLDMEMLRILKNLRMDGWDVGFNYLVTHFPKKVDSMNNALEKYPGAALAPYLRYYANRTNYCKKNYSKAIENAEKDVHKVKSNQLKELLKIQLCLSYLAAGDKPKTLEYMKSLDKNLIRFKQFPYFRGLSDFKENYKKSFNEEVELP